MKNFFTFLTAGLLFASCNGTGPFARGEIIDISGGEDDYEEMVLGGKLDNPYSIENVTKAFASLYPDFTGMMPITVTDLYVRFLPERLEDFDRLEGLGIELVDYPLDYEILRQGDYYHDPSVGDGRISWQYAVVPADFRFPPGIRCEILENCVLGENLPTKAGDIDWDAVEREAYRLTGNGDMLEGTKGGTTEAVPEGTITIADPDFSSEPQGLKGVKVSCNTFVRFDNAYTDENGHYKMNKSFKGKPHYRIVYKNKSGFAIGFNLILTPASYSALGSHRPSGVNLCVSASSDRKLFTRCAVNNAAYDYYRQCKTDNAAMRTPPANLRIWLFQKLKSSTSFMMQQGALIDDGKLSRYLGPYAPLVKMFLPDITLGLADARTYADVYASTVHGLAHASHYMVVGNKYWNDYDDYLLSSFISFGHASYGSGTGENSGYCEVAEMWAYYMQTVLYRERYPEDTRSFGLDHWFYPQIFLELDDKCLDRYRLFGVLEKDVTGRSVLFKRMKSMFPQYKTAINQAFSRYN